MQATDVRLKPPGGGRCKSDTLDLVNVGVCRRGFRVKALKQGRWIAPPKELVARFVYPRPGCLLEVFTKDPLRRCVCVWVERLSGRHTPLNVRAH